jgi:hypothetical protein
MNATAWQMELEKGGFCMRTFMYAAVSMSAVSLLAFGTVASSAGSAHAVSEADVIAGCGVGTGPLASGAQPGCWALPGTIVNPVSSISVGVNTDDLGTLLDDQVGQGFGAWWDLTCTVNGAAVESSGTYVITSTDQPDFTTIDLQDAVGSPDPSQCEMELGVETLLTLNSAAADDISWTNIGLEAVADTATPGAVYQDEGTTSSGAHAVICADDTANGNAGSKIQAFGCLGDLADSYILTGNGQLVHNGDCVGLAGSEVILAPCGGSNTWEQWSQTKAGGWMKDMATCLTASSAKDGTQLTVQPCSSAADQKWYLPAVSSIDPSPPTFDFRALSAPATSHQK